MSIDIYIEYCIYVCIYDYNKARWVCIEGVLNVECQMLFTLLTIRCCWIIDTPWNWLLTTVIRSFCPHPSDSSKISNCTQISHKVIYHFLILYCCFIQRSNSRVQSKVFEAYEALHTSSPTKSASNPDVSFSFSASRFAMTPEGLSVDNKLTLVGCSAFALVVISFKKEEWDDDGRWNNANK